MSSLKGDTVPYARLCHILKWEDFDGYGFNLHAEKGKTGQFIGKVDEGSPSQAAGLRQGDRIVEVNEINIANESHKQVVDRIKAFPNETKLLVVDQEADNYFKANGIAVKGTMTHVKVVKTPDKNPAAIEQEARSLGSNNSVDENLHKSIGSSDTSNSGSDSTVAAALANDSPRSEQARQNGSGSGNGRNRHGNGNENENENGNGNGNGNVAGKDKSLNLKMSAKELRARLAARKKYDPKKESIGFKDKFDIVQKL